MKETERMVSLIATSDLHGKMFGYDYTAKKEELSGSLLQAASRIRKLYDPKTMILADA